MDQAIDLRSKCPHFRILVVGRANAGKTTLLKKVCNSVEEPEIFGPYGNRLDLEVVEGSAKRGQHDIENQLIFQSNRQFIFHDSRGFESGSANEIQTVKDFITERAARGQLSKQLHAIWYCMPTDTTRPLLAADEQFFNVSGTGKVPVIAIFTKFDGLVDEAYSELRERGQSILDAKNGAPERAQTMLTSNFIGPLNKTKFRPSDFVRLDDMRMEQSDCIDLINKTAHALSDETLKLLFVSVQQNNIDVCIYYAMRGVLSNTYYDVTWFIKRVIVWFPHTWNTQTIYDGRDVERAPYTLQGRLDFPNNLYRDDLVGLAKACAAALTEKLSSLVEMIQTPDGRSLLCAALCICFAQTFIDGSAKALGFAAAFAAALDAYVGSSTEATVVAEIRKMPDSTHPPRPAAVVAEIRKITDSTEPPHPPQPASPLVPERTNTSTSSWLPQPAWSKKWKDQKRKEREERDRKWREQREEREREERQKQAIIDIVKTHRLRFHEDRKAQMGKANLP